MSSGKEKETKGFYSVPLLKLEPSARGIHEAEEAEGGTAAVQPSGSEYAAAKGGGAGERALRGVNGRGFLSRLFMSWLDGLVRVGYKRRLEETDLFELREGDDPSELSERLLGILRSQYRKPDGGYPKRAIWKVLWRMFRVEVILCMMFQLAYQATRFAGPVLLRRIVTYIDSPDKDGYTGYLLSLGLFLVLLVGTLFENQGQYFAVSVGIKSRSALSLAVFKVALNLDLLRASGTSRGHAMNLLTTDSQVALEFMRTFPRIYSSPLVLVAGIVYIYLQVGYSVLFGVIVMVLFVPLSIKLGSVQVVYRKRKMRQTDVRVKHLTDMLLGIKVLKVNAWEKPLLELLNSYRESEMKSVATLQYYRDLTIPLALFIPNIASVVTFGAYVLLGNSLDAATAFSVVAAFLIIRSPFIMLPLGLMHTTNALVSENRFVKYLGSERVESDCDAGTTSTDDGSSSTDENLNISLQATLPAKGQEKNPAADREGSGRSPSDAVVVSKATFSWTQGGSTLRDLTFAIPKGSLVAVVGRVGDGKSSLCSSLLGSMHRVDGSYFVNGSAAYCAQEPFIMNCTVRENILFNKPFDRRKYDQVLSAVVLFEDLETLPGYDMTEIGERGVNISGGQKARVALARAVYSDADIYVLDDVLSAVDAKVGHSIFQSCLCNDPESLLAGKTRIVVTNQLNLLDQFDWVLMLENGELVEQGRFPELRGSESSLIWQLYKNSKIAESTEAVSRGSAERHPETKNQGLSNLATRDTRDTEKRLERGKLADVEGREEGSGLKWKFIKGYWYAGACNSLLVVLSVPFAFLFCEAVFLSVDSWLAVWTQAPEATRVSDTTFVAIYFALMGSFFVCLCLRALLFVTITVSAARNLYYHLQNTVFYYPMTFFWQQPLGRVINRMTKDTNDVDTLLPLSWEIFLMTIARVIGVFAVISWASPYFLVGVLPLVVAYYFVREYYRRTSRELQRLESILRSPVFSHFSETTQGAATIKAFGQVGPWLGRANSLQSWNHRAKFIVECTQIWLSIRLEFIGAFVVLSTAVSIVASSVQGGLAGLALSYAMNIVINLNMTVQQAALVESHMNAVERVLEYSWLPTEKHDEDGGENAPMKTAQIPPSWPAKGHVCFQNVSLSYRSNLEPALRDLSVDIQAGTKVGIVGKTGSGKSTLMVALFRLVALSSGRILLDGIDITSMTPQTLRRRMTCIPQDPVLFATTLRKNIDPFDEYSEEDIWRAIEQADLRHTVESLDGGIHSLLSENGGNLSVGQRQLICIARAALKRSSVIMMDEATASIDRQTDAIIQDKIRHGFPNCTMLIIAHRLETVLDLDRILVMETGKMVEFGSVQTLLSDPHGKLRALVHASRK